ncbi:MAG: PilZ domain-containing protein [Pseudazoarcus pumilus]|nr:PilZ domain-containing protein [Pseudazoarcus pumilus]
MNDMQDGLQIMTDSTRQGGERRGKQRFVALRRGAECFWAQVDGRREPLSDMSLDGFGLCGTFEVGRRIEVVLYRSAVPDEIRGTVKVANCFAGAGGVQSGCVFEAFEGDGRERLRDWLIAHVIANATLPITEKDAERIVCGPSLI